MVGLMTTILLMVLVGVALARDLQCKPNRKCEGTKRSDTLTGTSGPDRMYGFGRDDRLFGGSDLLEGGSGNTPTTRIRVSKA